MSTGRNKIADFFLRAAWVIGYAILIRAFILLRKIELLFARESKTKAASEAAIRSGTGSRKSN
jgi:hypothetical protein